jgi:CxxC motif-containing protein (DUF1111 family)
MRLAVVFSIFSCALAANAAAPSESLSGGATTAFDTSRNAFTLSARNILPEHKTDFYVGDSFFSENWLAATPVHSERGGLGPLFVARSCIACHVRGGRGETPDDNLPPETMVVRISIPGRGDHNGPKPDPIYGLQLQTHALPGFKPETQVLSAYKEMGGTYPSGEQFNLRRPYFQVTDFAYGPAQTNLSISPLTAPALIGLGLLESVPEETLRERAANNSHRTDGIAGKVNLVWDETAQQFTVGRFGWKAEQPTVRQQCAAAFDGDMGLTTSIFPNENYTAAQGDCSNALSNGHPEVSDKILAQVVLFSRLLAVPARRDLTNETILHGEKLFQQLNCAVCHAPELQTGDAPGFPELSRQMIHPYTDLLLHDMGEGLSDHRQVFEASGSQWRTPPLWGIGLVGTVNGHEFFLHDGRARGLEEAILWHGGEAQRSQEEFRKLSKSDRNALLRFLESL